MELLHFTAKWCQPCLRMEPVIEEFLTENPDIKYTKIDIDLHPEIARSHSVMGVPTFISVSNGEDNLRATGAIPKAKLQSLFE